MKNFLNKAQPDKVTHNLNTHKYALLRRVAEVAVDLVNENWQIYIHLLRIILNLSIFYHGQMKERGDIAQ